MARYKDAIDPRPDSPFRQTALPHLILNPPALPPLILIPAVASAFHLLYYLPSRQSPRQQEYGLLRRVVLVKVDSILISSHQPTLFLFFVFLPYAATCFHSPDSLAGFAGFTW
jgi:hypothetical protein